jgi:hypothetical protein
MKTITKMKKILILLLITISSYSQKQTAVSINTTGKVIAYTVATITDKDTTYQRVDELPKGIERGLLKLKQYPKELLREGEVYQVHLRSNKKKVKR